MKKINSLHNRQHTAFSLIELSVVIAIIALIAGGVYLGKDLLESSKNRNILIQANDIKMAVLEFQDKYGALPGDMATATSIWGRADGNTPITNNCNDPEDDRNIADPIATCSGDGDRTIARQGNGENYELFRAFQHLANAKMYPNSYTGVPGTSGGIDVNIGGNVPDSDIRGAGYDIMYLEDGALPGKYFGGLSYRHVIHFGKEVSGNNYAHGVAISAVEASEIDRKIDDGFPGLGKVLTFDNSEHGNCASTDMPATATYQLMNDSGEHCALVFVTGF
jgi:prepilin-type N-terminal cleavage/methylation domain-containing protein